LLGAAAALVGVIYLLSFCLAFSFGLSIVSVTATVPSPIVVVALIVVAVIITAMALAVTDVPHRACNRIGCQGGRKQDSDHWRCYSGKSSASCQKLSPIFILVGHFGFSTQCATKPL